MTIREIRNNFFEYYRARGHVLLPSASLVPEGDVTTLFTGSGMQPLLPFLLGKSHPLGKRLVNSQKSFRTEDIDEVGDNRHTTYFEMLGNWSLGDYFKKEQLQWFFEFLTDEIGLDPNRLFVTVFAGDEDNGIPRDTEAAEIWKELFLKKGVEAKEVDIGTEKKGAETGIQGGRIFYYGSKNWWSRAGAPSNMPFGEPGGPDSEVFYEFTNVNHDEKYGKYCHPNCDCGRFMEIGNSVFMEYKKKEDGSFEKLFQKNVDFGGGLERIAAAADNDADIFKTDVLASMKNSLRELPFVPDESKDSKLRVVLDHARAAIFLISDGVRPSNKGQGYVLRRLLRRGMANAKMISLPDGWVETIIKSVADSYGDIYEELEREKESILSVIKEEKEKFSKILDAGLRHVEKLANITAEDAFMMHQSYGFPFELTRELALEKGINISRPDFEEIFEKHKEVSRAGQGKKFGGHGLIVNTGELRAMNDEELRTVTRLHTATHMLQQALREVLGSDARQRGSDITVSRARFDFNFSRKLTADEIKKIEGIVNGKIAENLEVGHVVLPRAEAERSGALFLADGNYPDPVSVYFIGPSLEQSWSREFCGGPHVLKTGEIGKIKILKEEGIGGGVRRIRVVVAPEEC